MLVVIEVALFAAGLSPLTTGRLPRWLLRRSQRQPSGATVRWLGLILILPFPIAFVGGIALNERLGDRGTVYAMIVEIVVLVAAALSAALVLRRIRRQTSAQGEGPARRGR
jgi:hypothetical protein